MITIKTATIDDVDIIVPLFDAYRQWYRQPSDLTIAKKFLTERLAGNESVIFIAYEGEDVAGFTQLYPIFSSIGMKRAWLLNDLFVYENHRKRGVAVALLERAKALALETGAKFLLLETASDNTTARRLYETNGWQQEEHIFYGYTL